MPEKTFHDRIVPAIAASAHAGLDAQCLQPALVGVAGVLATLVGMEQPSRAGRDLPQDRDLVGRRQYQRGIRGSVHAPADHLAREQIQHHREPPGLKIAALTTPY